MVRKPLHSGNRIRELREGMGMSREQLAESASVSVRAVVQWELGEREPGWFNMVALSSALGVNSTAFLEVPAERSAAGPGRPRKQPTATPAPKGPRGRRRKGGAGA
jgi:transcriptional regulator with XRE-family HTH domain